MEDQNKVFSKFNEAFLPYVFGKEEISKLFLITLLIKGHLIIEDFPGIGKTTIAKAFSKLLGFEFSRIQGTSDSLPQDIIGGEVYDFETKSFIIKKGPIFKEIVLIDEINRMHPKTQSAFLQCMEEKRISIAGVEYELPENHMIIATQNPIEYSGTFSLPEAQKDRFSCVISIGYPSNEVQKDIIMNSKSLNLNENIENIKQILDIKTLKSDQDLVSKVFIKDEIVDKFLKFSEWSRNEELLYYGFSPRGINIFVSAMKANAFLNSRDYVVPEDGRELIVPFLYHRIFVRDEFSTKAKISELLIEKYREFLG